METSALQQSDRIRQVVVTVSYIACLIGTLAGIGLIGTPVQDSSRGVLSSQATLIAPAVRAFSIWSVIYTGLLAYTIWQWLPKYAASERARTTGYLAAWSMLLNAGWLLVTQIGWIWVSVAVILALAVDLALVLLRLGKTTAADLGDKLIVDGTFGAYLGWVLVASIANVASALVSSGMAATGVFAENVTAVMLVVAAVIGVAAAIVFKGRIALALALGWGLTWIAVGRLTDQPSSTLDGIFAAAAALIVLASGVVVRLRERSAASATA